MDKDFSNDWKMLLNQYGINIEGGTELVAVAALVMGLIQKGSISEDTMKNIVDFLVKNYDKYPALMIILSVVFSGLFVLGSISDKNNVQRLHKEITNAFKYPPGCWKQRFTEIRESAEALKVNQRNMGMIKAVAGIAFAFITFNSTASTLLRGALGLSAGTCVVSATINGMNYYELKVLIERMIEDGYLDQSLN